MYERTAVEMLEVVIGGDKVCCTNVDCRYNWLGINPLGEIFPCDRYYPKEYSMGLIGDYKRIEDIFESAPYKMYSNQVQKRFDTKCKECGYHFACNGGCNGSAIESSGSAEGVEETYCNLFKLKFNGVYKILRDIDIIHDENLNPLARELMLDTGFYSVRDIKEFVKDMGKKYKMQYDPKNLLKCSEFEIFRGVNYRNGRKYWLYTHSDVVRSFDKEDIRRNEEKRKEDLLNLLKQVVVKSAESKKYVRKEKKTV
jgi:radical SAM protein with 4Fe4S-binding SPASM domain